MPSSISILLTLGSSLIALYKDEMFRSTGVRTKRLT